MNGLPSRFLVRPNWIAGESLSSWRQRTAWANGYRLFPVADGHVRRSDPDMGFNERDLQWAAALHDSTVSVCREMTLDGQTGRLVSHVASRSQPRWWLRCRYGEKESHHGSMFCSQCLAEDQHPHFRLSWRYAFATVCLKHHVLLSDQCPHCGRPPWPSACGVGNRISPHFMSFNQCPYCDFKLTRTLPSNIASPTLVDFVADDPKIVSDLFNACPVESLSALRAICHMFVRVAPRRAIIASNTRWAAIAKAVSAECLRYNSIDHAPVGDRHLLITASLEICRSWPDSFLAFALETGISRAHFNGSTIIQPAWMNQIVDQHLARQNRFVTAEKKLATFMRLESLLGRRPFKYEIRRALNWQGQKDLDSLYASPPSGRRETD